MMPIAAIGTHQLRVECGGRPCCTNSFSISKKLKSLGGMVFITLPLPSWNTVPRWLDLPERRLAAQEFGDAGAKAAGLEG